MNRISPVPRRSTILLILAVAFGAGLAAAFATAASRTEPYVGVYREAAVPVELAESGTLVSLAADHGSKIEAGEMIATIKVAPSPDRLARLERKYAAAKQTLEAARDQAAVQLALHREQIEQKRLETRLRCAEFLRSRLQVQTRRQALLEAKSDETPQIVATARIVPSATDKPLDASESERLDVAETINRLQVLDTKIQLCEDRLTGLDQLAESLPGKIRDSLGVSRLEQELASISARLEAARQDTRTVEVDSPAYGRLGIWRHDIGEKVLAGQTLVEVFDSRRPFVLLRVPVAELLELTAGRQVRVAFSGITTDKPLSGVIADVRSEAEVNADSATTPGATEALVRVRPVGRLWPSPPPGTSAKISLK